MVNKVLKVLNGLGYEFQTEVINGVGSDCVYYYIQPKHFIDKSNVSVIKFRETVYGGDYQPMTLSMYIRYKNDMSVAVMLDTGSSVQISQAIKWITGNFLEDKSPKQLGLFPS